MVLTSNLYVFVSKMFSGGTPSESSVAPQFWQGKLGENIGKIPNFIGTVSFVPIVMVKYLGALHFLHLYTPTTAHSKATNATNKKLIHAYS